MNSVVTEPPFDTEGLREQLLSLTPPQLLAFGLTCSERLYPNYVVFSREQGWGQPESLRASLDLAWDALSGRVPPPDVLSHLERSADSLIPRISPALWFHRHSMRQLRLA